MKTVKEMIEVLKKFPEDAECYAYEGEGIGLAVADGDRFGFIHCGPFERKEKDTEWLNNIGKSKV